MYITLNNSVLTKKWRCIKNKSKAFATFESAWEFISTNSVLAMSAKGLVHRKTIGRMYLFRYRQTIVQEGNIPTNRKWGHSFNNNQPIWGHSMKSIFHFSFFYLGSTKYSFWVPLYQGGMPYNDRKVQNCNHLDR